MDFLWYGLGEDAEHAKLYFFCEPIESVYVQVELLRRRLNELSSIFSRLECSSFLAACRAWRTFSMLKRNLSSLWQLGVPCAFGCQC